MPRVLIRSTCLVWLAFGVACGDDDGGEDTRVTTGLPRNDALSSLDDEDALQACTNTLESFNEVLSASALERVSCVIVALSILIEERTEGGAGAVAECKGLVNDCLEGEINGQPIGNIDVTIVDEMSCTGARATATFEDCEATVGDYEDCAGEVKAALRRKLTSLSCDGLTDVDEVIERLNSEIDISDAPKCEALQDECPMVDFGA